MAQRLPVLKTYKLLINGAFPRTESGRSIKVNDTNGNVLAHVCHGSRKDLRNAVEAASKAADKWAARTAYNRGQILYRMAEMLEGKRDEFAETIKASTGVSITIARKEIDASIDRLICFAGWADKYTQTLGCNNAVAGPHYNFTVPEPTGVVGVVAPKAPSLLGLITLMAPALCAGNVVVAVASEKTPLPAAVFAEVCATSDVPAGVINLLTGRYDELLQWMAEHRQVRAITAANMTTKQATTLRLGTAENIKRVNVIRRSSDAWYDTNECESPWTIEPFVEMKTIWHPVGA